MLTTSRASSFCSRADPRASATRLELSSYGGETASCELVEPTNADELSEVLQRARIMKRRVTFRGAGHSFGGQSLNTDLVIGLSRLRGLHFHEKHGRLTAGAGETWGALVTHSLRHGLFPAVVVTTREATLGGTASGNCVSRFSPLHGQDGDHVIALKLVTASDDLPLDCSRESNREAFLGAIGGLGYLGAIAEVTLSLQQTRDDQIETRVVEAGTIRDVLAACSPTALAGSRPFTRYAVLMPDLTQGLAYASQSVSGQPLRRYRLVHEPRSVLRLVGELIMRSSVGSRLIWFLGYHTRADRYVDPIEDFTFFMDGNARFHHLGRRLGFAMRLIQQSFVVPVDATLEFIECARRTFSRAGISPTLADVLYCPEDESLMSATCGLAGFFATFAFETSDKPRLVRISHALRLLSRECLRLQGRVQLTKNVHTETQDLEAMYAASLPRFLALKRRFDPEGIIRNAFLEQTFPSLLLS